MSAHPPLGWSNDDIRRRSMISYPGEGSLLTVAPPGSGKTRSVALPELIRYPWSVFSCDFQGGKLTAATALWRHHVLGHDVRVFDPFRVVDPKWLPKVNGEPCYARADPLDFVRSSLSPHTTAHLLAEALIPVSTHESYWGEAAQSVLAARMLFVAFDPCLDEFGLPRDFRTVWLTLSDPQIEKDAIKVMAASGNKFVADQASAFLKMAKDDREMRSIRQQIRSSCGRMFGDDAVLDSLTTTNIRFSEMVQRPITYYFVLPASLVHTHGKAPKLVMTMALTEIERTGSNYKPGMPHTLFPVDEFPILENFRPAVNAMARMRQWGVKLHLYCQSLSQLKAIYQEAGLGDILGTIGLLQCFGGTNDFFSAETISKLCGDVTRVKRSINDSTSPTNPGGQSWSTYGRRLILPEQIMHMKKGAQLIKMAGTNACMASLFEPSLSAFPDYTTFMAAIEKGASIEAAKVDRGGQKGCR